MLRLGAMLLAVGFVVAGFGLSGVYGQAQDDAFKKELKAMAGSWKPISAEADGRKVPDDVLKENSWTRDEAGKVVMRGLGGKIGLEGTVKKIDATKKPKTIDMEVTVGVDKGEIYKGIYELDGDTLRICFVRPGKGERPTEFSAERGSNRVLTVHKRAKK